VFVSHMKRTPHARILLRRVLQGADITSYGEMIKRKEGTGEEETMHFSWKPTAATTATTVHNNKERGKPSRCCSHLHCHLLWAKMHA
jgi:hypothetical protein